MKVSRICSGVNVNLGLLNDFEETVWITLKPPELVELYMKTDTLPSNKDSAISVGNVSVPRRNQVECGIPLLCYRTCLTTPYDAKIVKDRSPSLSKVVR